jgi:hypothetical protein
MSGSSDWGWRSEPPAAGEASPPPPAASREPSKHTRIVAIATIVAVAVIAAVALLGRSGAPAGGLSTNSPSQGWSSAQGAALHTSYLAGCQQAGGSATYCGCLFEQLIAQKSYGTPALFASSGGVVRSAYLTPDAPGTPAVIAQLASGCAAPSSSATSTRTPI